MQVTNQVYPTEPVHREKLMEPGPKGPIVMVNLLKFKDKAAYRDGRQTHLSGKEAYQIYGEGVSRYIGKVGGRILFAGDVSHLSLGLVEDLWDAVILAEYPNRGAMVAMGTSEEFQELAMHREAGLQGQLNIETVYDRTLTNLLGRDGPLKSTHPQ